MKKIFTLVLGLVVASSSALFADETASESLVGQTYTGLTSELPGDATFTYPGTAPGVYSELTGKYVVNLGQHYYQISSYLGWTDAKAYVINQDNVIVYEASWFFTPGGGRNLTEFGIDIPEDAKITTPGTYRIIYPTGQGWDTPNDAYITPRQSEKINNFVAGPYVVGELGESVSADFTVEPQGEYTTDNSPEFVTLTVNNAAIFNCEDIDAVITVKDSKGTELVMEPGVKDGNTIKWEFPVDAATNRAAVLDKGEYTITVNFAKIVAYTESLNPLQFPETADYIFTMEGGVERVVPQCTINPAAGQYDTWTASGITVKFNDYKLANAADARTVVMTIVEPDFVSVDCKAITRSSQLQLGFQPAMTKEGRYKCIVKLEGLAGVEISDATHEVELQNIEFEYYIGIPTVDASYSVSPAENASLETGEFTEVVLTITNAATLEVAEDFAGSMLSLIEESTQTVTELGVPAVDGKKLTWNVGSELAAGNYTVAINLSEGVSGTTADGYKLSFPDNIEYVVTLTEPVKRELVDPNPKYSPAAGKINKWTATKITCTWDETYKLDKDGRDMFVGRPLVIEYPDGTTKELVPVKASDSGVNRINYLFYEITVNPEDFSAPGKYKVTFPTKGIPAYKVANKEELVEFDRDCVVEYEIPYPETTIYLDNSTANFAVPYANYTIGWNGAITSVPMTEQQAYLQSQNIILHGNNTGENKVATRVGSDDAAGFVLESTGNMEKTLDNASKVTYNGVEYTTIKSSKQVLLTCTLPEGCKAVKATLISYCNVEAGTEITNYWNVNDVAYSSDVHAADKTCLATPDVFTYDLGLADSFTFWGSKQQNCFLIDVEYIPADQMKLLGNVPVPTGKWSARIPENATHVHFTDGLPEYTTNDEIPVPEGAEKATIFDFESGRTYNLSDAVTGVEAVEVEGEAADAVYYNLQGIRVANPEAGQVYIRVNGNTTAKVRF